MNLYILLQNSPEIAPSGYIFAWTTLSTFRRSSSFLANETHGIGYSYKSARAGFFRPRPGPDSANFFFFFFFSDFDPDRLGLNDFKTGQFLYNKRIFLLMMLMIYFSAIYYKNQFSIDCFPLFLNTLYFTKSTAYCKQHVQKIKYRTGRYFIQTCL